MKEKPDTGWGFGLRSARLEELCELKERDLNDPDAERTIPFEIDIQIWNERIRLAKEVNLVVDSREGIRCRNHPQTEAAAVLKCDSYKGRTYFFCPDCTLEKLQKNYYQSIEHLAENPGSEDHKFTHDEGRERFERYQTALKEGRFVTKDSELFWDLREIGYKCHHCGLYFNSEPRVANPCTGNATTVCWICEREL